MLVLVAFGSPKLVIEVSDGKHDAELGSCVEQQTKQADRVTSTRDGDGYAVSGTEQLVLGNERVKLAHAGERLSSQFYLGGPELRFCKILSSKPDGVRRAQSLGQFV
jgi:hypothetical protein